MAISVTAHRRIIVTVILRKALYKRNEHCKSRTRHEALGEISRNAIDDLECHIGNGTNDHRDDCAIGIGIATYSIHDWNRINQSHLHRRRLPTLHCTNRFWRQLACMETLMHKQFWIGLCSHNLEFKMNLELMENLKKVFWIWVCNHGSKVGQKFASFDWHLPVWIGICQFELAFARLHWHLLVWIGFCQSFFNHKFAKLPCFLDCKQPCVSYDYPTTTLKFMEFTNKKYVNWKVPFRVSLLHKQSDEMDVISMCKCSGTRIACNSKKHGKIAVLFM